MSATPPQRFVPAAATQISTSKSSQKKREKAAGGATAGVDDTSATPSPLTGSQNLEVVTNGVPNQGTSPAAISPSLQKLSPITDLINKRLKATQKKVTRIKNYSSNGVKLNQDQKRLVATLPGLEAVVKELKEVKKAIEVHESELSKEESAKRAAAKATGEATASLILTFVHLSTLIDNSHPLLQSAEVTETESLVISSAVETLTGDESQSKEDITSGLISGEGELQGIAYSRLIEIAQIVKHSPQHPSEEHAVAGPVDYLDTGAGAATHPGSLLLVQESELDSETDVHNVGDVPSADAAGPYEAETEPEHKSVEVAEPTPGHIHAPNPHFPMVES